MLPLLAGGAAGVLSGFGVGGGTLLLVYMTAFAGLDQRLAQGINLLYFLPSAAMALPAPLEERLCGPARPDACHPSRPADGGCGRLGGNGDGGRAAAPVLRGLFDRHWGMELFGKERGGQEPSV